MFAETNVSYEILDRYIIVHPKNTIPVDFLKRVINLQQQKVTGTITDASTGEPVIGANVVVEGTTIGVVTDANGIFSIDAPSTNSVLIVSFVGYNTEKIQLEGRNSIEVKLVPDITKLEEIIVVGYGTQKKANLTGAVTSVKMDEALGSRPLINASAALQGAVPGLFVSGNHQVGQNKSFQIRGAYTVGTQNSDGSFGATIPPLVLIDNVEGDISMLNPNDIESISVLKDAASSAIYGD